MKKYEVTDIPHPYYPWLHRIRAMYSFRSDVQKGQLGGYVQSEDNLSQEGTCWLFDNAISFENAYVSQDAVIKDVARVQGNALVSGTAECTIHALVCDHAIVTGGLLTGSCLAAGNAHIFADPQTGISPRLSDGAKVYGEVSGLVCCCGGGVILPGMALNNSTRDTFSISESGVEVSIPSGDPSRIILPPNYGQNIPASNTTEQRQAQLPKKQTPNRGDAR